MSENPYAPPALESEVPDAPRSHGWKIEGKTLHVSVGAVLPMIDPYNGQTADRMTMHIVEIKRCPLWIPCLIAASLILLLAAPLLLRNTNNFHAAIPIFGLAGVLCGIVANMIMGSIRLKIFCCHSTLNRIRIGKILGGLLTISLFVWFISGGLQGVPWFRQTASIFLLTMICVRLFASFFLRRFICRRKIGLLYEVRGIHPKALELLESRQSVAA